MLLYQCYIFIVLYGISISFQLPHGDRPDGDSAIKSSVTKGLSMQLGQGRSKHIEADGDSDGFKKELQVPINIYKPPSVNNGVIKRIKRNPKSKSSESKDTNTGTGAKKKNTNRITGLVIISILVIVFLVAMGVAFIMIRG